MIKRRVLRFYAKLHYEERSMLNVAIILTSLLAIMLNLDS